MYRFRSNNQWNSQNCDVGFVCDHMSVKNTSVHYCQLQKEALRTLKHQSIVSAGQVHPSWTFQVLPSLYQHSQKVA